MHPLRDPRSTLPPLLGTLLLASLSGCTPRTRPTEPPPWLLRVTAPSRLDRLGFPEAASGDALFGLEGWRALRSGPRRTPLERDLWLIRLPEGPARAPIRFSFRTAEGRARRGVLAHRLEVRDGTLLVHPPPGSGMPTLRHRAVARGALLTASAHRRGPRHVPALEATARPGAPAFGAGLGWRDPWAPRSASWRGSAWVAIPLPDSWLLIWSEGGLRWRAEWDAASGGRRWAVLGDRLRWTVRRQLLGGLGALGLPGPRVTVALPASLPEGTRLRIQDGSGAPWLDLPVAKTAGPLVLPSPPARSPAHAFLELPGRRRSEAVPLPSSRPAAAPVRLPPLPKGGRLRILVRREDGTPLTARIRIRAIKGAPRLALGPDWLASGAGEALVADHGEATVRLPAGRYRIQVTHGPAWSRAVFDVRLHEDALLERQVTLIAEVPEEEWVPADLHVHAAPSPDSRVSLSDRLRSLRAEGIRFAVATDHNQVSDYTEALEATSPALRTASGVEVTTWAPAFGHFNVYPVPRHSRRPAGGAPPYQGLDPARLFTILRSRYPDALLHVCHPRLEPQIGYFELFGFRPRTARAARRGFRLDFDVLEVFNGYDLARPERVEQVLRDWMALLGRGHRITGVGSSDSHTVRFHWAGYPRTWVRVPGSDGSPPKPEDVFTALRAGRAVVSSGPLLMLHLRRTDVAGRDASGPFLAAKHLGPGDSLTELPSSEPVPFTVRLLAPSWMPLRGELTLRSARRILFSRKLDVPVGTAPRGQRVRIDGALRLHSSDRFVLAVFRSDTPLDAFFGREGVFPIAFTNPIWLP